MQRSTVPALALLALLVTMAAPVKAFEFAPSDLWNVGAGIGYLMTADADSSKIAYEARAGIPAFGLLKFLGKIPGFSFELSLGYDYGLFFQFAPAIRAKLFGPVYAKVGAGLGYNFEQSLYAPVVAGLDIYTGDVVCLNLTYTRLLAAAASIENASRITAAISISGRYEN